MKKPRIRTVKQNRPALLSRTYSKNVFSEKRDLQCRLIIKTRSNLSELCIRTQQKERTQKYRIVTELLEKKALIELVYYLFVEKTSVIFAIKQLRRFQHQNVIF